ncbi:MAG: CHAT domain-containing protein [Chroococcus sp. CMT-3BRIN-NPC107]|nr:CHAT domain-containing protein [Chroococcus sp. CMT-3BRIN-NPC107]
MPPEINTLATPQKSTKVLEKNTDQLEVILVMPQGEPIRRRIPAATRKAVLATATKLRNEVTNTRRLRSTSYLASSQQMYSWLIAPIKSDLEAQNITNLVFLLNAGLRSMPAAAMHDGKGFLIEKYSVGLMPSISLTDTRYVNIKNSQVLALGISESTQGQVPLPAVSFELSTLVNYLWTGSKYINQSFTRQNLKSLRRQQPYSIVHMVTHADISSGAVDNSYIQLWNDRLRLNQIRQLELNNPQVEMLVLSACRTALGNEDAELGFAGLAVNAGVKTTVASLWFVNDTATAAFMTQFYRYLNTASIKADAMRQAQVAMAKGEISIKDGRLQGLGAVKGLPIPQAMVNLPNQNFSHPYFWSGFTMVGNPW